MARKRKEAKENLNQAALAREELRRVAEELDLTELAQAFPAIIETADNEHVSGVALALRLLKTELKTRHQRSLERRLRRARLGSVQGVDGFNFSLRPQLDERLVRGLLDAQWAGDKRNLLLLGGPGLGKTRLGKAFVYAAVLAGHTALAVTVAEMIEDLYSSQADMSFRRRLGRYLKPSVLLLDDFGNHTIDTQGSSFIFRVISERHETGSIVLTANSGFSRWKNFLPSEAHAVATVDRLLDRATILRFSGTTGRRPKEVIGAPFDDDDTDE